MADGENKGQRFLGIFDRLSRGETISKEALAREYGVTEKSIQRDIDDIRSYLSAAAGGPTDIRYDWQEKGYRLVEEESGRLTRKEILAMAKILLESRAFAKEELHTISTSSLMSARSPEGGSSGFWRFDMSKEALCMKTVRTKKKSWQSCSKYECKIPY